MSDPRPHTLVIDNHDSFTWNLAALLRSLGEEVVVLANDDPALLTLDPVKIARVVLSPGPGTPEALGHVDAILVRLPAGTPILGVCLGMQWIGIRHGLVLRRVRPRHGVVAQIEHAGKSVFCGLPSPFAATRYHSLGFRNDEVELQSRSTLDLLAWCDDGGDRVAMALRHRQRPMIGVQFHPESFMTVYGAELLRRFVEGRM